MDIKSGQVGMFIQSFNTPGLNLHLHKAELCDLARISAPSIGDLEPLEFSSVCGGHLTK
jgi:hypothetical protein